MKRLIRIISLAVLLLMFCTNNTIVRAQKKDELSQSYEIKTITFRKDMKNQDGITVLSCKVEYPQLVLDSAKQLTEAVKQVNHTIEKKALVRFQKQCNNAMDYTKEFINQIYHKNMPTGFLPFLVEITYDVTLNNAMLFSFYTTDFEWLGGAHPDTQLFGSSYNLETGNKVAPTDLLKLDEAGVKTFIADSVRRLYEASPEEYFPEEVERLSRLEFAYDFYLTKEGIVFFFPPYQIAPYARGVVKVELKTSEHPELFDTPLLFP